MRTLPAVSALRALYAGAHLAWLVESASRSAVEGQPWVDEVLLFPRGEIEAALRRGRMVAAARTLAAFLASLRRHRFDLVLDFHGILKTGLLALASGAPERVGYARGTAREGAWLFARSRARLAPGRVSRYERNQALVDFLAPGARASVPAFRVDPAARARMARALGEAPAPVAIHPGSSPGTPHKRWPPERYAAVARALAEGTGVGSIVLTGPAPGERELAGAVVAAAGGAARHAPPTPGLADLAARLERCRLYLGGDTGPMHLAALVGTPVVALLGPTDPVENAPHPGVPARVVRTPVACSPCRRGCAAAVCMRRLAESDVVAAARELLAGGQGRW